MEAEGRLLHRDWALYDTAHAVFRPRHMTPEELEQGYAWFYERLFSHASIWRRRPEDWRAVAPYLAMSYLYKRSNRFWQLLIKTPGRDRVAAAGGTDTAAPPAGPAEAGGDGGCGGGGGECGSGGGLILPARFKSQRVCLHRVAVPDIRDAVASQHDAKP